MQVTPVPAVHALRIRQKPLEIPATETDKNTQSTRSFADMTMTPAHVASAALRDTYHGTHAEYATQLLVSGEEYPETQLERHLHMEQYVPATAHEDDERSYTLSLSA
ncbi:hypothetical protein IWQ55_002345 [Labrenzia sp. EL_208]|uniref:hypothetical protein n=1 Tax=Roseibium album TaxID=311410 RepID=UPI000D55BD67|nr:hypothetical protein [Roseibium album]MBG6157591.1 hypothetical protein [Labrenzia sp. EL_162]MBG6163023.1 hypothetical protein [Labrenzia sp. EL_195]MBG6174582.1 hypothetical protein [Labrenzia sp. EL_132]MBG6196016.1 hypothetical protein [Labrenzia sp. EL_159]MBG6229136.1 hypothetical protein [Labrenzia sp. EL_208]